MRASTQSLDANVAMFASGCTPSAPLVSVVMPAFNMEKYIGDSISSVIAQTLPNWELLVIDDCSTDNTRFIVRQFVEKDQRIILLELNENAGTANARNKGLTLARGRYVAFLDSDDLWEPDKLELQCALAEESGAEIVCSSYDFIDEKGCSLGRVFHVPKRITFDYMLGENAIGCSSCLVLSSLLGENPFSSEFWHEDYLLWMSLLRNGSIAMGHSDVLMHYRQIKGSRSSDKIDGARRRWQIYRRGLGLSRSKSFLSFARYFVSGFRKYYL